MIQMKRDRLWVVMNRELTNRMPVTAYRHHTEPEYNRPCVMVDKLFRFQWKYDQDVMKIDLRVVYHYEARGNEYDYDHYNDVVPTYTKTLTRDYRNLGKVSVLSGDQGAFTEQLDMYRMIVQNSGGKVPIIQSTFTPVDILLNLCGTRSIGRYHPSPREESPLTDLCLDHPDEVGHALKNVAEMMADYCSKLLTTGIDGVFHVCLGMIRSGYFTLEKWKEFVEPYGLMILEALRGSQVIIHTYDICDNPGHFTSWPISITHRASSAVGRPPIWGSKTWLNGKITMDSVGKRPSGQNKVEEIGRFVRTTLQEMQDEPFLLAPSCSVSIHAQDDEPHTFHANVGKTLRQAMHSKVKERIMI